jgi:hypothetical protein
MVGVPEVNADKRRARIAAVAGAVCLVAGLVLAAVAEAAHQMILSFLAGVFLGMGLSIVLVLTVYYTGERREDRP